MSTDRNEFREEHYRRLKYVNHYFGRSTPKEGWKTERGRIYIILGEPNDVQRILSKNQVYPTEIWFYQGLTDKGLPPVFNLVFSQEGGMGEYKLYSPLSDGPQGLLTAYYGDQTDYLAAYKKLVEIEPNLAEVSLNLIPGESNMVAGRPSLSSDILIDQVENTPLREVKDIYAKKFLKYKEIVEVEYTPNYMDSNGVVFISREPSNIYMVNYAIEPERLSVNMYENIYYTSLQLNEIVKDMDIEDKIIYQFDKTIQLEFSEKQIEQISHQPVSIQDVFPLIPGRYYLTILLKNKISKKFTIIDRELVLPVENDALQMTSLFLGNNAKFNPTGENRIRPFQTGDYQIYFQANHIFLRTDKLVIFFQLHGLTPQKRKQGKLKYSFLKEGQEFKSFTHSISEYEDIPNIIEHVSLKDFPPAHYTVQVGLQLNGKEIISEKDEFDLTYTDSISRPWIYSKLLTWMDNNIVYDYLKGIQYFNQGDIDKASQYMQSAYRKEPDSNSIALSLEKIRMNQKKYAEVESLLAPILDHEESPAYEVFFILGKSYQYQGKLQKAVKTFDQAISQHGLNTTLLNVMGECYFQMGYKLKAQEAWEKSLEIDTNQSKIKKNLEMLKEKKR